MSIQDKLDTYRASLDAAARFIAEYGSNFPDDEKSFFPPLDFILYTDRPQFAIRKDYCTKAGEVFGRDGWTRRQDRGANTCSWTRKILGCIVTIENCEEFPTMSGTPVPPKAFPVQLEDVK